MNKIIKFLIGIYKQRHLIIFLAKHEYFARYTGTMLGVLWSVFNPVATVLVFWFVFSVGLKISVPGELPFLIYFVCGLIPWLMFNDVISTSTNGVRNNLNLIKKTIFPSEIYPFVYVLASSVTHLVYIIIAIVLLWLHGISLSFYFIQIIFYYTFLVFFMIGLCWVLSALNVFHRDIGQAVPIMLNLWFWATPLIWSIDMIPEKYAWVLKINPLVYIVEGYRKSLLYDVPFWQDMLSTVTFLCLSTIIFFIGAIVFRKFKMEFADAL